MRPNMSESVHNRDRLDIAFASCQTALQRQIDSVDRQIDHLVYQLYGLTDAEIALVESAAT